MPGKAPIDVILGAGGFGRGLTAGMKTIDDKETIQSLFEEYRRRGYNGLDTARLYGSGTSEEVLADMDYAGKGFEVDTKILSFVPAALSAKSIHQSVGESLKALKTNKVRVMYFHTPDRETPLEEGLAAINEEYKNGRFEKFGLSNFRADEVEQVVKICKEKGYVLPSVYQGLYNVISRAGEKDLFPVLRKHGMSFVAYSPVASSFLSGDITKDLQAAPGSKFDPNSIVGTANRTSFWKDAMFEAIETLKQVGAKHGITLPDIALRWIVHHSQLKREYNDAIITGATRITTLKKTLDAVESPPLPADVLTVVEDLWEKIKDSAPQYHL